MFVAAAKLRDFRSHSRFELELGPAITVLAGPNGSGKTNILESIHFGLTGRSCRTSSDRRVIAHGQPAARVELELLEELGSQRLLSCALDRSGTKETKVDGTPIDRADGSFSRPMVVVFLPDRLSLLTGSPGIRRAHIDGFSEALNRAAAGLRSEYTRILIQRNSLLAAARASGSSPATIDAWSIRLADQGVELALARQEAVDSISGRASAIAAELGLRGDFQLVHRPGCEPDRDAFIAKLEQDLAGDIDRGYTHHGPHRGDLLFKRDGLDMKEHSSQGEKRIALLSLLLAEREELAESTGRAPLLLLDDVMSELDSGRRSLLAKRVSVGGQCVITATEFEHVPDILGVDVRRVSIGGSQASGLRAA